MIEDSHRPARLDHLNWLSRPLVVIPPLAVLAVVLRLPNLGESLWYDEVMYSTRYMAPDLTALWHYLRSIPGGPLYPVLAYAWSGLFGDHEVVVRLPSMFLGVGSIVLTWILARRMGGPLAAMLAALLLCLSPAHVWYSQEAAPYALMMFSLLLAVVSWPLVATSWTWSAIYLVSLTTACLTHFFAAPFLAPLTWFAWTAPREGRRRILLANTVALVTLLSVLALKALDGELPAGMGFLRPFTVFEWWMVFFHWGLHGNSLWTVSPYRATPPYLLQQPWLLAIQLAIAGLVLRGLLRRRPGASGAARWMLSAYLVTLPLTLLVLTLVGFRNLYIERYLLPVVPFLAIALALGATGFTRRSAAAGISAAVVLLMVVSYGTYLAKGHRWTVYKQNPDWASAARYIRSQRYDLNRSIFLNATDIDDFEFYLRKSLPRRPGYTTYYAKERVDDALARRVDRFVVVKNRFWPGDIDEALADLQQDSRLRSTGYQSFKGVELYEFVPVDPARRP